MSKEISLLATTRPIAPRSEAVDPDGVSAALDWLVATRAAALRTHTEAGARPFGLFGSSIAATRLAQGVDCAMTFFVDEDFHRHGGRFFDRPVLSPAEVPAGSVVFVGVGGGMADSLAGRLSLSHSSVSWIPGPPFL